MAVESSLSKATVFRALHQDGVFVIPNPWDIGTARILESLGFPALATTSSGFAQSLGRADGQVTLDEKLEHCRSLAAATRVPISVDTENCFGDSPEEVATCIRRVAETGVVGASVEDYTGDPSAPLYDFTLAVERVSAAAEAARSLSFPFVLTARAEQLLRSSHDVDEAIRRLVAFEEAGADVVYAPALKTLDEVREVCSSVTVPVNVLGPFLPAHSVEEIGAAGARRVSVGGGLARAFIRSFIDSAARLKEEGALDWAANAASAGEVDRLFKPWASRPEE